MDGGEPLASHFGSKALSGREGLTYLAPEHALPWILLGSDSYSYSLTNPKLELFVVSRGYFLAFFLKYHIGIISVNKNTKHIIFC